MRWSVALIFVAPLVAGCASGPVVKYRGPDGREVWCGSAVGGLLATTSAARDACIKGAEEAGWKKVE